MVDIARDLDVLDVGPALELFRKEQQRVSNIEQQDFLNQIRLQQQSRADRAEGRAQSAEQRAQANFQNQQKLNILKLKQAELAIEDANADRFLRKVTTLAPAADTPEKVEVLKKKLNALAGRLKIDDANDLIGGLTATNRMEVAQQARVGLNSLSERKALAEIDRIRAQAGKFRAEAQALPGKRQAEAEKIEAQTGLAKAREGLAKERAETERLSRKGPKSGTSEFERLVESANSETDPAKKRFKLRRLEKLTGKEQGSIEVDERGNFIVRQPGAPAPADPGAAPAPVTPAGGEPTVPSPAGPIPKRLQITGNQADKLRGNFQMLENAEGRLVEMLAEIEKNPAIVGSRGTIRSFVEKNLGAAIDIAGLGLPDFITERLRAGKKIAGEAVGLGEGPTPGEISSLEDFLATALAQARTPNQDRILAAVLKDAKADVNLTGATSTEDVRNRLQAILSEIQAGKQIFSTRLQQGVTGRETKQEDLSERDRAIIERARRIEERLKGKK